MKPYLKKKRRTVSPEVQAKGKVALEAYRKERAEAKAKGEAYFSEWQKEQELKKARKNISPLQAIKNFCNECVGQVRNDITNCSSFKCPLHIYRPYQKGDEE
jgi:predicted nucleic acid-binding Zn ribbon protein